MSETVQPCGFWKLAGVQCRGGEGGCSRNVNKDCVKAEASSFALFFFFGCCVMLHSIDWILARFLIASAVSASSFLLTSVRGGLHIEWGNDYFDPRRVESVGRGTGCWEICALVHLLLSPFCPTNPHKNRSALKGLSCQQIKHQVTSFHSTTQ